MAAQRVMVAMSGGVDSSVAAALVKEAGHDVVGVTLRLWGGESDSGCCSVSDVDDARRVADTLGIDHHVFNMGEDFDRHVVEPYVADHAAGRTPNPCIECNRHIKFDRLLRRARSLGFDRLATGHHARLVDMPDGTRRIARAADQAKDQSYVLYMLGQDVLAALDLPVGEMPKHEVRERAAGLGLRTADKPDSQDVCFITSASRSEGGRQEFLGRRIPLTPGRVLDGSGSEVGRVDAVEMVTLGQRKGMELAGGDGPRYATAVDTAMATVTVGPAEDLFVDTTVVERAEWAVGSVTGRVLAQTSAHGQSASAVLESGGRDGQVVVIWDEPHRRVAPGQSVVFYEGDLVLGGALAC
ncbi:MAG: tRNA 2-thiouridine(34) synthase MnmA [Acidimicrobiia bacterium]|nr:tRNA 2-thiouridine(34) synthase MnmA [Actinomycetota bacterium]MBL6924814.1 tRNA 2-thiouridine(34) synthase MnmA [Acidimicrobiia bacterium]MBL6926266.1 tRNA 2-thiouridine(34) synthase MnmA [Acidimicrobiia bacterium]